MELFFWFVHWFVVGALLFTLSGDGEFVEDIEAPAERHKRMICIDTKKAFFYQYSRVMFETLYSVDDLDHEQLDLNSFEFQRLFFLPQ